MDIGVPQGIHQTPFHLVLDTTNIILVIVLMMLVFLSFVPYPQRFSGTHSQALLSSTWACKSIDQLRNPVHKHLAKEKPPKNTSIRKCRPIDNVSSFSLVYTPLIFQDHSSTCLSTYLYMSSILILKGREIVVTSTTTHTQLHAAFRIVMGDKLRISDVASVEITKVISPLLE